MPGKYQKQSRSRLTHGKGRLYLGIYRGDETLLAPRRIASRRSLDTCCPRVRLSVMGGAKAALIAAAQRDDLTARSEADIPIAANFAPLIIAAQPDAMPLRPLYLAESYAKRPRAKVDIAIATRRRCGAPRGAPCAPVSK